MYKLNIRIRNKELTIYFDEGLKKVDNKKCAICGEEAILVINVEVTEIIIDKEPPKDKLTDNFRKQIIEFVKRAWQHNVPSCGKKKCFSKMEKRQSMAIKRCGGILN